VLLFIGYWIAPFCAVVLIDWHYNRAKYTPSFLRGALSFRNLGNGWPAIVAFVAGFGAMVPFMNTSIVVGPAVNALDGADIAFYVGFVVAGVLYYVLRRVAAGQEARRVPAPQVGVATQAEAVGDGPGL
jgi:NCS1 family nucleobase:cation symporter-1